MQHAGRAWKRYLLATFGFGALAAVACQTPKEPATPDPAVPYDPILARCAKYEAIPNARAFCVYGLVRTVPTAVDATRLCTEAGPYAADCVRSWVSMRLSPESGISTEALLDACGTAEDCAFEVLDARASMDIAVQAAVCVQHAGAFASDCVGHAAERWWLPDPSPEEMARVASLDLAHADRVAFFVAASVACYGKGTCDGAPAFQAACEISAETFRKDRMRCPGRRRPVPPGGAEPRPGGAAPAR